MCRVVAIGAFLLLQPSIPSILLFSASMGFLWLATMPPTSGLVALFFGTRYMTFLYGIVLGLLAALLHWPIREQVYTGQLAAARHGRPRARGPRMSGISGGFSQLSAVSLPRRRGVCALPDSLTGTRIDQYLIGGLSN